MWPFKKKKEEEKAQSEATEEDEPEQQETQTPADANLSSKIEMIQADLTKINGVLESFKEMRKSNSERFATINEQIGELRGSLSDTQRAMGAVEVKSTKAADLVESVHPDKLMIQVQKEDGKIEGLRGILEAKEEMMKNIMEQLKQLRNQMNLFRGVEQVIKLNEEVKDDLMSVKKIAASVERHADRVDNVFVEAQKSFEAIGKFSDRLDSFKIDIKEISAKADKTEVGVSACIKRNDFEARIEKIDLFDKRVKGTLDKVEAYYKGLDNKFQVLEAQLKAEFELKIERAEVLSRAIDRMLRKNPVFAKGLSLQEYLRQNIEAEDKAKPEAKEEKPKEEAPKEEKAEEESAKKK